MTEQVFWAANQKAPLVRDEQIELMKSAKQRREENLERWKEISENEN